MKITQSAPKKVYRFVPLRNFTYTYDIDWSMSVAGLSKSYLINNKDCTKKVLSFGAVFTFEFALEESQTKIYLFL